VYWEFILPTSSINFKPPVIAHRGANNLAPENTLSAFQKVRETGAKWIEFDVMLTAWGEVVVIHDESLVRTTGATGNVRDHAYSYLQTLDAGSWFDIKFAGERIPTFQSVIEIIRTLKLCANVEIKAITGDEEETVIKVLRDIEKYWTPDMPPPLISSFSMPVLKYVRHYSPQALIALLIHDWFGAWKDLAKEYQCVSVDINHEILDAGSARVIKDMDLFLLCYTVNDPQRALELFSWGVDAVFTDNVARIMSVL
jgi:glycerophosphoryl diester phosphodiesterase